MKKLIFAILFGLSLMSVKAQSCEEFMSFVKNESYGSSFYSYTSDAISYVTFYDVLIDYQYYYFAIVCFKNDYSGCSEYIYQVGSNTKSNYSMSYLSSAGKAFWKHIQPYNNVLGCAPNF